MKEQNRSSGFTLLEIIISIAIIGIIASFGVLATTDSFRGSIFRSERSIIVTVLQRARSRSMNNFFEMPHGACLDNTNPSKPNYIIFRKTYIEENPTNEIISGNRSVTVISNPNIFYCSSGGIIFEQLSGNTFPVEITITENNRTSTVSTNSQGQINW